MVVFMTLLQNIYRQLPSIITKELSQFRVSHCRVPVTSFMTLPSCSNNLASYPKNGKPSLIRDFHTTTVYNGQYDRRDYAKDAVRVEEGAEGEKIYQQALPPSVRQKYEEYFPTLETHSQLFDGLRYDQIPICKIRVSKNNTRIRFIRGPEAENWEEDEEICKTSMRYEGFKNAKKKTTIAGQATGVAAALRALRRGITQCRVKIRGLGPGRMSSVKGLTLGGLKVVSITDYTPLPELGPRPKKRRRV